MDFKSWLSGWGGTALIVSIFFAFSLGSQKRSISDLKDAVDSFVGAESQTKRFQRARRAEMAATEQGSELLRECRTELAKQKPNFPREAAICLLAREKSDARLRAAMQSGSEFGDQLLRWNAEARANDIFCAYAMRIGGEL